MVCACSPLASSESPLATLQALIAMHNPADAADLEAAKRRLAFEELLLLQLKLLLRREIERTPRGEADLEGTCIHTLAMMQAGRAALGFALTDAQDRVLTEVHALSGSSVNARHSPRCECVHGFMCWSVIVAGECTEFG